MWTRFLNIMKYVWKNPVVQFACFTLLDWLMFMFHKSTKHRFNKNKKLNMSRSENYSIGTNEDVPEVEPEKTKKNAEPVAVEKPRRRRATRRKVVEKIEEVKPAKQKRVTKKKSEEPVKKTRTANKKKTETKKK